MSKDTLMWLYSDPNQTKINNGIFRGYTNPLEQLLKNVDTHLQMATERVCKF